MSDRHLTEDEQRALARFREMFPMAHDTARTWHILREHFPALADRCLYLVTMGEPDESHIIRGEN